MKNSVSCLNAKAIPIRKHLRLNLSVSENYRLLMCKCIVVRAKRMFKRENWKNTSYHVQNLCK